MSPGAKGDIAYQTQGGEGHILKSVVSSVLECVMLPVSVLHLLWPCSVRCPLKSCSALTITQEHPLDLAPFLWRDADVMLSDNLLVILFFSFYTKHLGSSSVQTPVNNNCWVFDQWISFTSPVLEKRLYNTQKDLKTPYISLFVIVLHKTRVLIWSVLIYQSF